MLCYVAFHGCSIVLLQIASYKSIKSVRLVIPCYKIIMEFFRENGNQPLPVNYFRKKHPLVGVNLVFGNILIFCLFHFTLIQVDLRQ